jgi:hypothetical protein
MTKTTHPSFWIVRGRRFSTSHKGNQDAVFDMRREKLTHSIADWKQYEENPPTDEEHSQKLLEEILRNPYVRKMCLDRGEAKWGKKPEEEQIHVVKKPDV